MAGPEIRALLRALVRDGGDGGEARAIGAFVHLFAEEEIADGWISLAAFEAPGGQHLGGRHRGFAAVEGRDGNAAIAVEGRGRRRLAAQRPAQLARVDHAAVLAGDAQDHDFIALDVVLLQQHGNGAGVATLGYDSERPGVRGALGLLALLLVDEIERQVLHAGRIHNQRGGVFGRGHECRLCQDTGGAAAIAQHSPDFAALKQLLGARPDVFDGHHQTFALSLRCGPSALRSLTNSVTTSAYFTPSAADTHDMRKRSGSRPINFKSFCTR